MKLQKLIILIGGNEGDVKQTFLQVVSELEKRIGGLTASSSLYETDAWGPVKQANFLNQALVFRTTLSPVQCLRIALETERKFGRVRAERYGPRTIDIDILYLGNQVIQSKELVLPHPEIANRRFVLVPLNEVCPGFVHPLMNISNRELLKRCKDQLEVRLKK